MTGGIIAVIEMGPRLKDLYRYMELCSDDIDGCDRCSMKEACEKYCDVHLYNKGEVTPEEHARYLTVIMARRARRTRVRRGAAAPPACVIYTAGLSHTANAPAQLVCGRR